MADRQARQQLSALMAQGRGREDTSSLLRVLERESRWRDLVFSPLPAGERAG